jgi:hypothetical protein
MAVHPQIGQGTLNRIRGSFIVPNYSSLTVTAPFLGKGAIGLSFQGQTTVFIDTMTGAVTSPEPYLICTARINLLRTQNIANLYKTQMETDARIGDCTVVGDSTVLANYQLTNCAVESVGELNFAGEDAGFVVTVTGYYIINNALWNLV